MKSTKIIVGVCLAVAGYVCADATCECLTTTTINDCEYLNYSWGCPFLTCPVEWSNLPLSRSGPLSSQMHCSPQSPQAPFLPVGESFAIIFSFITVWVLFLTYHATGRSIRKHLSTACLWLSVTAHQHSSRPRVGPQLSQAHRHCLVSRFPLPLPLPARSYPMQVAIL